MVFVKTTWKGNDMCRRHLTLTEREMIMKYQAIGDKYMEMIFFIIKMIKTNIK